MLSAINAVSIVPWFVYFMRSLQFYKRVMRFCDKETEIYEATIDIYGWFYPLTIFEIVKGSVFLAAFVGIGMCAWMITRKAD
mmetsp:Transcript_22656/g.36360  ORF Transcript_22656/g.36360 Transcript_22656/m.36360 type:complete len:82 (-) Transcript_22656:23-268(-)